MTVPVQEQLRTFATTLLERRGALVEWPAADRAGTAMLPPEVAAAVGTADDVVPVGYEAAGGGLAVNLAGDFLEWSGRLLDAVPSVGTFRVRDLYLKRKDLDDGIGRAFTWLNAKVELREGRETTVEYHTWWFHAALSSEDRWETCFCVSLNAASGVEVEMPDPLGLWELQPQRGPRAEKASSYPRAAEVAQRRLLHSATTFLDRMDVRLQRDHKRLHDYYNALVRESERKKVRGHTQPDPEKVEATKRAVNLELRRKLAELDERYAIAATVRPVILIRTELPVLAVDLSVFRKQAHKKHTVYWNPLLKQFEPLRCSGCGDGVFAAAFANETVEPLCSKCGTQVGK
jgi:hypothetical protein